MATWRNRPGGPSWGRLRIAVYIDDRVIHFDPVDALPSQGQVHSGGQAVAHAHSRLYSLILPSGDLPY